MFQFRLAAALVVVSATLCGAARASDINEKFRAEDQRLSQPITIATHQVLVGDLLAEITRQTGVKIEFDGRDRAPGALVLVSCHNTPACEMLDSLWSLLSNQDGQYRWYREGTAGAYRYTFYEPDAVKKRTERTQQYLRDSFVQYVNTLCDLAELTPAQRLKKRDILKRGLADADGALADRMLKEEWIWSRLQLFNELVPRGSREAVLFGQPVDVAISDASDRAHELFTAMWTSTYPRSRQTDGTLDPAPPKRMRFYAIASGVAADIVVETMPNSLDSLITGLPLRMSLRDLLKRKWYLPADAVTDRAEDRPFDPGSRPAAKPNDPLGLAENAEVRRMARDRRAADTYTGYVKRIDAAADVPVLALCPEATPPVTTQTPPTTVKEALKKIGLPAVGVMHKWRNGVLIVSYPEWFCNDDDGVPYALVNEFLKDGGRSATPESIARLMQLATPKQVELLSRHYALIAAAAPYQSIFVYAKENHDLLTDQGLVVYPERLQRLRAMPRIGSLSTIAAGQFDRIRIVETTRSKVGGDLSMIEIQVLQERHWKPIAGFPKLISQITPK